MSGVRQPKLRTAQRKKVIRNRWVLATLIAVTAMVGWALDARTTQQTVTPITATTPKPEMTFDSFTAPRPGHDVSWHVFAGIDLPVSATAGPYEFTETRSIGFAHTEDGAAMAAAHLLVRTFPFAGSDAFKPTIAEQVTGPNAPAMARLTQQTYEKAVPGWHVKPGQTLRATEGWIAGYRPDHDTDPTGPTARVDVLIAASGEGLGFTTYRIDLTWQDNDWRLVAPAWGDWLSNAKPVANPYPSSYHSYDTLGIGPGGAV